MMNGVYSPPPPPTCHSPLVHENELLLRQNRDLQKKLCDADRTISNERMQEMGLETRNSELMHELNKVEHMSREMQLEKEVQLDDAEKENSKLRSKLHKVTMEKEDFNRQKKNAEQENIQLTQSLNQLNNTISLTEMKGEELENLINKLQDDKLRLSQRVEKLTANERALVIEIERLKRHGAPLNANGSIKRKDRLSAVESYMLGIEEDRDYWKREAGQLRELAIKSQTLGYGTAAGGATASRKASGNTAAASATATTPATTALTGKPSKKTSELYSKIQKLEAERDMLRVQLSSEGGGAARSRSKSPGAAKIRSSSRDGGSRSSNAEVMELRRERDNLRSMLNSLERRVTDIKGHVNVLSKERDRFSELYDDARKQIQAMHTDLLNAQKSEGRNSSAAHHTLKRMQNELDESRSEVTRLAVERDNLLEKYRITVDTANEDKALLETKIDELSDWLAKVKSEKNEVNDRSERLRLHISELESQLSSLESSAEKQRVDMDRKRQQTEAARCELDMTQKRLVKAERNLEQTGSDLSRAEHAHTELQKHVAELEKHLSGEQQQTALLQTRLGEREAEAGRLQNSLGDVQRERKQLTDQLAALKHELHTLLDRQRHTEHHLSEASRALDVKDKELRCTVKQLEGTRRELEEARNVGKVVGDEVDQQRAEVHDLNRQMEALHGELLEVVDEREELRQKCQDYVAEVKRVEDLLAANEAEQRELLAQYKYSDQIAQQVKLKLDDAEKQLSASQMDLEEREADLQADKQQISQLEKELSDRKLALRELEIEASNLRCSNSGQQELLRVADQERDTLLKDLAELKELVAHNEKAKATLETDLQTKTLDMDQLASQMDDVEAELEELRERSKDDEDRLEKLQQAYQTCKEKETGLQMELNEKVTDYKMIEGKLGYNEEKLEKLNEELRLTKTGKVELEQEVDRLQRALTKEKFEKEHALSELRIQSLQQISYQPSNYRN